MAAPPTVPGPDWVPIYELGVVGTLAVSALLLRRLDRSRGWAERRRRRLLLGVPWGTLLTVLGVLGVYLLVQGGLDNWHRPLTIPFRSWSYFYPLGMVVAPFAHDGVGHLIGNLVGTVVLGSLAEYAWGHFPEARGSTSFGSLRTNPYARALLGVPTAAIVAGLLTSVFGWGALIGFSGVVFAFAGFSLVRYPLATVVALVAEDVVHLTYNALQDPVLTREATSRFITPWWSGIAVQGHFLGLFLGVLAGAIVFRRRHARPARLWAGTVLTATTLTLWALWWYRGGSEYVLYRGLGLVFVLIIAIGVTVAVTARRSEGTLFDVPRRQVALLGLLLPILVVGLVAVPLNATTVADPSPPGSAPVDVGDYTVVYAENVTNQQVSVINISAFGETTGVRTSGVIVISEERHVWTTAVSRSRLAFGGRAAVRVGGLGWREVVVVRRQGWTVDGNRTVYRVIIRPPGGPWRLAHLSGPSTADPVIAGHTLSIHVSRAGFEVVATSDSGAASSSIPAPGNSTVVGEVEVVREGDRLIAMANDTRVRFARKESYD